MGWFGHGKYDGDGTSSTQIAIVEETAKKFKFEILDKKGKPVDMDEFFLSDVSKQFVHDSTAQNVSNHLDFILKKIVGQPKVNKKNGTVTFDEYSAVDYMMLSDFYMNHNLPMPKDLHEKSIQAMDYLTNEHADDFNSPGTRRRVLNKFIAQLENYPKVEDPLKDSRQLELNFEEESKPSKPKMKR